ncbi:MAG TPA: zinc ribbon domain-containing protein [Pyrinomonadaceae bacterium]|nr:zinc ribbon domain-containing protein [Pyrinomonadaceae bacterium]
MFCPHCGQQQVSDVVRFCSRCGFLLEGINQVLALGGNLPTRVIQPDAGQMSPRRKGVRQGAMLMLSTLLAVPIIAILGVTFLPHPEVVVPIAALLCFVGGLLRILYALLLEENTPQIVPVQETSDSASQMAQIGPGLRGTALPPPPANAALGWRPRADTAEFTQPPSVTENTTRLLGRDEPKDVEPQ